MSADSIRRNNLTTLVTAWTTGIQTSWTISQIRDALIEHAEGIFQASALLMDVMNEDDQLPQSLERRVQAVASAEFELRPVVERYIEDGRNRERPLPASDAAADWADDRWYDWCSEEQQAELLRSYHQLGVAVGTIDWTTEAGEWRPAVRALPMEFCYWDDTRQRYMYSAQQGLMEVTPGDGKWLLLEQGPRGYRRGTIRGMALLWLAKQLTFRDWNRYNERHGLPIIKAMVPVVAEQDAKDDMWEQLQSLGSETVAELPQGFGQDDQLGFGLELLEAKAQTYDTFRLHLERLDRKIIIAYQGSNLGTEVTGQGSRAAAVSHDSVSERLAGYDARRISTSYRWQLLWPALSINLGTPKQMTPWTHWVTEAGEDLQADATALSTLADAISKIQSAGYDINNLDEITERYGIELSAREPEPEQPQPPDEETPDDAELHTLAREPGQEGYYNGLDYIERLQKMASQEAAQAYAIDAEQLAAVVSDSDSPDALRDRLRSLYGSQTTQTQFSQIMSRAVVLAQLAGRYSLAEDMESDGLGD